MFEAEFNHQDIREPWAMFKAYQDPYCTNQVVVDQLRRLICDLVKSQKLSLKVTMQKKGSESVQVYTLVDEDGKEYIRVQHTSRALLNSFRGVVRNPMSLGQINREISKVSKFYEEQEHVAQSFQSLLYKLAHQNEEKFLLEAYEEDDNEFVMLMQSKQGVQSLEVFISR